MGLGGVGLDFQGRLVMRNRLVELSAVGQRQAEVAMGLGEVGLDFQGLAVMGDGLVHLPATSQNGCKVVVGLDIL